MKSYISGFLNSIPIWFLEDLWFGRNDGGGVETDHILKLRIDVSKETIEYMKSSW